MKENLLTQSEEGATAVEFALLAIPYVFLMVGIIELSIMYAAAAMVEGATNSASRLVRTGQLQAAGGDPETVFRDAMCDFTVALVDCSDIRIEATTLDSFLDSGDAAPVFNEGGQMEPQGFDVGGSNERVLIRTAYTYDMMTPFIGPLLAGNADGEIEFISTIVFQSEPYEFEE